jgi:SNF2 family DNA or RNA helicase
MFKNHDYPTKTTSVGQFNEKVIQPSLPSLIDLKIETAYFSLKEFSKLFRGIRNIYQNEGRIKLVIGLNNRIDNSLLESALIEDLDPALMVNFDTKFFDQLVLEEDEIIKNRIALFAFLKIKNILEIKIGSMKNKLGSYHPKNYILTDSSGDIVSSTGSTNDTTNGMRYSYESDAISLSWEGRRDSERVLQTIQDFDTVWKGLDPEINIHDLDKKMAEHILDQLKIENSEEGYKKVIEFLEINDIIEDKKLTTALIDSPIFSEFSLGGVALHPHQTSVLDKALSSWPIKKLFADEVGLGKTLEVGATIKYLEKGVFVSNILIMPPASLVENWQQEMKEYFGMDFLRYDSQKREWIDYDDKPNTNFNLSRPYRYSHPENNEIPPLAIISQDLVGKTDDHFFKDIHEFPDVVVVDEAHHVRKTKDNQVEEPRKLFTCIESIKHNVPHLLFASATPMSRQVEEYYYLLSLLGLDEVIDEESFDKLLKFLADQSVAVDLNTIQKIAKVMLKMKEVTDIDKMNLLDGTKNLILKTKEEHLKDPSFLMSTDLRDALKDLFTIYNPASFLASRNMRSVLKNFPSSYKFPERVMKGKLINPDELDEGIKDVLSLILNFIDNHLGKTEEVRFQRKSVSGLVKSFYQQRFWSSFYSAKKSLHNRKIKIEEHIYDMENDTNTYNFDETSFSEFKNTNKEYINEDRKKIILDVARNEMGALGSLIKKVESIFPADDQELGNFDPKMSAITDLVRENLEKQNKIILFSRFTDTLDFAINTIVSNLDIRAYGKFTGDDREYISYGKSELNLTREQIREKLDTGKISILFCSDAASEGLNLQSASVIINIDVPWVPTRLEQRIGRIDRLGQQKDEINVYNAYYPFTYEENMYERLIRRQADINFTVGPFASIIGDDIRSTLQIEDLQQFEEVTDHLNAVRSRSEFVALFSLWETIEEPTEIGNIIRTTLLDFVKKYNPETELNIKAGTQNPISFNAPEFSEAVNSYSFDLENYTDINFVTVDDLIWGMSLKKNGTNYLINPKNILNIIFHDPDVQDHELLESLNLDTSLEELTYIYEKHQVPLVIPKHFKIKISESDLPYNYKSTLCLVPLSEFLS